mmetsp:Transcript_51807/g.110842  ORF Transcript_51807/g.110842 Transcript_51807/m.110842 type:complete len:240 (+) Transcript_51807:476-1195(+)
MQAPQEPPAPELPLTAPQMTRAEEATCGRLQQARPPRKATAQEMTHTAARPRALDSPACLSGPAGATPHHHQCLHQLRRRPRHWQRLQPRPRSHDLQPPIQRAQGHRPPGASATNPKSWCTPSLVPCRPNLLPSAALPPYFSYRLRPSLHKRPVCTCPILQPAHGRGPHAWHHHLCSANSKTSRSSRHSHMHAPSHFPPLCPPPPDPPLHSLPFLCSLPPPSPPAPPSTLSTAGPQVIP